MEKTIKVNPKVIGTVWKHWRASFGRNKFMLLGTFLAYSATMYIDYMFKPIQWKKIFDSFVDQTSPWNAFYAIVIASSVAWVLNRIGETCIVFAESNIIKDLKNYCLRKLLGKDTHFFHTHASGGLTAKWKRFFGVSEVVIDEIVFSISRSILLVTFVTIYSMILIPDLSKAFISFIVIFVIATIYLSWVRMKYDLQSSSADSITTGKTSDIIASVSTLRTFTAIEKTDKDFQGITKDDWSKRRKAWFIGNIQWSVQGFLILILEVYCMNHAIEQVERGIYTIGTAAMIQTYIASLGAYMWGLGKSLIRVRAAFADAYEMAVLLNYPETEPTSFEEVAELPECNGISLRNVSFSYGKEDVAINNFSFDFEGGHSYGIVGKTGSGKSTLTKLLLRMYEKKSGNIFICDTPIEGQSKTTVRSWISYVEQNPQFPSLTVREIIKMGKQEATDGEIEIAARQAQCDFIWDLEKGFETEIGERGIKLSGGERQRLAIAAAILKDAPIVIMDEPTSALDAKTEWYIQNAIKTQFEGKTLIIVAHRLSTVAPLDEIILMGKGEILAHAPHNELLSISEEYSEMWKLQTEKN